MPTARRTSRPRRHGGFTLFELIIVMMIITVAMGIIAPTLRGWSQSSRMRDATGQFLAVAQYARTQAVSTAKTYRLTINGGDYQLTVQEGDTFVQAPEEFGRSFALPDGYQVKLIESQGGAVQSRASQQKPQQSQNTIDFFPDGRTQVATVRISSDGGDATDIACSTPAETFHVVTPEEARR